MERLRNPGPPLPAFRKRFMRATSFCDESMFASGGTAEVKSWLAVFGAMAQIGVAMTVVDYVPCYRSQAGTGNAMGFIHWTP